MHIYKLLRNFNYKKILKKEKRLVIILDNVKSHKTDLVFAITEKLNIYLVFNAPNTPRQNPIEKCWDIQKSNIKRFLIESKTELIETSFKIFNEKCNATTLAMDFKKKFLPHIS